MTIEKAMAEISRRIRDEYKTTFTDSLIKTYFLKSLNLVFNFKDITPSDYFGLMITQTVSGSYSFGFPVRRIESVFGSTGEIMYIPKTIQYISEMAGQKHLQPFKGQVFYYLFGDKINFIKESEMDNPVTVNLIRYPFDTSDDLNKYYSDYFVELAIREAISRIIAEVGVPNDSNRAS